MHRRSTRTKRRRSSRQSMTYRRASKLLRSIRLIEGIKEIILSPLTQKFVECDIGNKISPVNPWIYVDKEKIETHLEFYQEDSCFYPIQEFIETFPKNEILVGSFICAINVPATFFICTTLSAEETVLYLVERQRLHIRERVKKMQIMEPETDWKTLGSEKEIEGEMNLNIRNLYVVNVNAIILMKQKTKFVMCFAEDLSDGYKEMLPGRNTYNIVIKKRLDKGVQCTSILKDKAVQSSLAGYFTKGIQYCYEYEEIKITDTLSSNLRNFFQFTCSDVCKKLAENIELNLEANDYESSQNYTKIKTLHEPIEIKVYQEITHCTGKRISCIAWNALTSGIVAAAYVTNPLFQILKGPQIQSLHSTDEVNFALIWEYKNNVNPKLYLHGQQEISSMSFCPYNKYILVTGYINGQIAIWDLTENFKIQKPQRYLTIREEQNRIEIMSLTTWMKNPLGQNHVFPVIVSKLEVSHTSAITSITWIPPDSFTSVDDKTNTKEYKLKFVTSELSGNVICIWQLDPNKEELEVKPKTKFRTRDKPEALSRGVSKLKKFQARFAPLKKLYVSTLTNPKNHPMIKILPHNELYSYEIKNPNTLSDLFAETNFSVTGLQQPFDSCETLVFSTGFGVLQLASCVGPETSDAESIEICRIDTLPVVHDGPILICEKNAFFPNIILTIGGTVFAIWDLTLRLVLL